MFPAHWLLSEYYCWPVGSMFTRKKQEQEQEKEDKKVEHNKCLPVSLFVTFLIFCYLVEIDIMETIGDYHYVYGTLHWSADQCYVDHRNGNLLIYLLFFPL